MSHVADGILHAYLDGALDALSDAGELPDGATAADIVAHLSSCADCRARLETERAIREGAGIVLNDAAPLRVAAPPLSGITAAPRSRRARWLPMSWAATVLLAVGAGWWGSELWRAGAIAPAPVEQDAARMRNTSADLPASGMQSAENTAAAGVADRDGEGAATSGTGADTRAAAPLAAETLPAGPLPSERLAGERADSESLRAEPRVAAAPAVREPIGAAVGDRAAAAGDSNAVAAALAAESVRSEVARLSQDPQVQPPAAGAVRSLQRGVVPESVRWIGPLTTDAAALKQFAPGISGLAAFDSIAARERTGSVRFEAAPSSEPRRLDGQVFIVTDASEPSIEVAHEPGQTIVRVRQALRSGEEIELISFHQHTTPPTAPQQALPPEPVTVTAAVERAARESAPERRGRAAAALSDRAGNALQPDLTTMPGARTLPDGRQQILLRDSSGSLWVAMRAALSAEELHALVARLRAHPPR